MAQRLTEAFVNTNIPGSYVDKKIKSTPVGVASSGNIVIMGEADGGAAVKSIDSVNGDLLKDNYYTPDQLDRVKRKYISGNIVEAFRAISAPSADADIVGTASRVYIVKTNQGSQASAIIPSAYGTLYDKNYGVNGNKYSFQISQVSSESVPSIVGSDISYSAVAEITTFVAEADAADSLDGDYIEISSPSVEYYLWFNTGAGAGDPAVVGKTGIEVTIGTGDAAIAVADAIRTAIAASAPLVFSTDAAGSATINITNLEDGLVISAPTVGTTGWGTAPVIVQIGDDADGSFLNGASFSVREEGGAASVITLSGSEADHDSVSDLASEIQTALTGAGLSLLCTAEGSALKFALPALSDNAANALSYGRSFELIDSTLGDLVAIGHVEDLYVSSQEPEIQLDINRADTNVNEEYVVKAENCIYIGYEGSSGELSINSDGILSTIVVGGSGSSILSLDLAEYVTLNDLATYINSLTGYSCSIDSAFSQISPSSALDVQSSIGIASSIAAKKPGRIKKSLYNFTSKVSESVSLDFVASVNSGLPNIMDSISYLSGGAKGATSSANVVSAVDDLETIDVNFVIPLFSRDASDDITDGLTSSSSTYTIAAVNALVKSHCLQMSTPKLKKHRSSICSIWDSYLNTKAQSGSLGHYRLSLTCQKVSQVNDNGVITKFLPWYGAVIAAGMQCGGFYKAIFNKLANVISFEDPSGFDSSSPGDVEDALDAGLLILEKIVEGNSWVSDQTSYGIDENFVYNSIQAVYTTDLMALDLAKSFKRAYVGKSKADIDAASGLSFIGNKMDSYRGQKLIVASQDAPLGYLNAKVSSVGAVYYVSVEVKPSTAIYFIPINLEFSQATDEAE